jgi:hypothetical protein
VKKTSLSIATIAAISLAAATAGFAAELPTYQAAGLPISPAQVGVLGAANVQEQTPVSTATASPHQVSVLTPRHKVKTAEAVRIETGRAAR